MHYYNLDNSNTVVYSLNWSNATTKKLILKLYLGLPPGVKVASTKMTS